MAGQADRTALESAQAANALATARVAQAVANGLTPVTLVAGGGTPRLRSDLSTLLPTSKRGWVYTDGAVTSGDGTFGPWYWVDGDMTAPDGTTIIQVGTLPGRWHKG
jgi:hypothetical protein